MIDIKEGLNIRATGTKYFDDDRAWINFMVLDRVSDCIDNEELLEDLGMDGEYYGGPGRQFERRPCVRHSNSRTLITQSGGWDI